LTRKLDEMAWRQNRGLSNVLDLRGQAKGIEVAIR
jgi:hypothetical protein